MENRFSLEELKDCFTSEHILPFFEQMDKFQKKIIKVTAEGTETSYPNEESITDFLALALSDFDVDANNLVCRQKLLDHSFIGSMKGNPTQTKIVANDESKGFIFYYTRSNGAFSLLLLVRYIDGNNEGFYNEFSKSNIEGAYNFDISVIEIKINDEGSLEAVILDLKK
ncbi:hypothetical protein ACTFIY_001706 [Dictyostelium cf. discoideum]